MAKAISIVLLLAASAAIAAGSSGSGTGADAGIDKSLTVNKGGSNGGAKVGFGGIIHSGKNCQPGQPGTECKDVCERKGLQNCKESTEIVEVCRDVSVPEKVEVCREKCYKVVTINIGHAAKGRRLLDANNINLMPHMGDAHAAINKDKKGNGGDEVCKTICKPTTRTRTEKRCKEEPKRVRDCKPKMVTECRRVCTCDKGIHTLIGKLTGKGN